MELYYIQKIGIGGRLKQVRGMETLPSFASKLGVSKGTLINYENEASLPDARVLKIICEKFDINPAWLLLGEGAMKRAEKEEKLVAINDEVLEDVVVVVERYLEDRKQTLSPKKRAMAYSVLYELFLKQTNPNERDIATRRVLKLVA